MQMNPQLALDATDKVLALHRVVADLEARILLWWRNGGKWNRLFPSVCKFLKLNKSLTSVENNGLSIIEN